MQKVSKEINPIRENIETVADLHKRAERGVSPQQRAIEKVTGFLGRPAFLFIIFAVTAAWIVVNILLTKLGIPDFDPPPFIWLQGILSLGALLQATMILITENRQNEMLEKRTQLDLQVSLLLDRKMSKLIAMVDQLRQTSPALEEDTDPEVEALKGTINPHQTLKTLDKFLQEEHQEQ